MIEGVVAPRDQAMQVIEGVEVNGRVNTTDAVILEQIRASIRLGYPQIKTQAVKADPVALVCGGPSLTDTLPELVDAVAAGAKVVTVNGAYQWCLDHHIVPSMHMVMDARAENARFIGRPLPRCHYVIASQCHPDTWAAVAGRPNVWIYHVGVGDEPSPVHQLLDEYYLGHWHGIGGGTTVGTRALALLRMLGYVRFDIFGLDSCWLEGKHHAYDQPENARDKRISLRAHPTGHPGFERVFHCAPWHVQQAQDFLQMVRFHGNQFLLNVHGNGLIAFILRSTAEIVFQESHEGA
jgi:hypothetical protein